MSPSKEGPSSRRKDSRAGYLVVVLAITLAFVAVAAAMQALALTGAGLSTRAYDQFRQRHSEGLRLEKAVTEALWDQALAGTTGTPTSLRALLQARLDEMGCSTCELIRVPDAPLLTAFPSSEGRPNELVGVTEPLQASFPAELSELAGPRVAAASPQVFEFARREQIDQRGRVWTTRVTARAIAVPLTRYQITAYDLPSELGSNAAGEGGLRPLNPRGLAPGRDEAFIGGLRAGSDTLPYHYRRRAALATAYADVFSQRYIDHVVEYAGLTHFHALDGGLTAHLAGWTKALEVEQWDLGKAGLGTFGDITADRDAAVVFTESGGQTLRLVDSVGDDRLPPMLILLLGPSDPARPPLMVEIGRIARPTVVVGYHVQIQSDGGVLNGALFLDPCSGIESGARLGVGHLSYWGGSAKAPKDSVVPAVLPAAAEAIAPRVVYIASSVLTP